MPTATHSYDPSDMTASTFEVDFDVPVTSSELPAPMENYVLIPGGFLPADQEYYWTAGWQSGERESTSQLAAGNGIDFETAEDAIRWLLSSDD